MFAKEVILALALLGSSSATMVFTNNTKVQNQMFTNFKADFSREYATREEEATAFKNFVDFLRLVDERNLKEREAGGSAMHGITQFSDISQADFEARYLKTEVPEAMLNAEKVTLPAPEAGSSADWTGKYTTAVKNQGYCGSCWAHSVVEQLESDSMRTLGTSYVLSPQQLTSCDTVDGGCNGGWPTDAYDWIESNGGVVQETDYPYTSGRFGITGSCDTSKESNPVLTVSKYYTLSGETSMASHAVSTGPIAIAVDATTWNSYTGGIMSSCGTSIDHAVQAVGVDTSSSGYWKVRNSWATSWGEDGFIRLAYGKDTCALSYIPTYVDAARA